MHIIRYKQMHTYVISFDSAFCFYFSINITINIFAKSRHTNFSFFRLHHFPLYPFSFPNQPFIDRYLICFHSFSLAELSIERWLYSTAMNSKVWPYEWIDDNDCSLSSVLIGVFVLVCNLATFKNKQKIPWRCLFGPVPQDFGTRCSKWP